MGRCNNRRTQEAALAARNTPSRARFSKPPPSKRKPARGGGRNEGRGGRNEGEGGRGEGRGQSEGRGRSDGRGQGGRGGRHTTAVIEKIAKRVQDKSRQSTILGSSSKKRHPLDGVDISKLDEITLSEESIMLVTKLLMDLNVMESTQEDDTPTMEDTDSVGDGDNNDDDVDTDDDNDDIFDQQKHYQKSSEYEEYEEDVDEKIMEEPGLMRVTGDTGWEGDDDTSQHGVKNASEAADVDHVVRQTPLFLHLTSQLSFSDAHAQRACLAVENWEVPNKANVKDTLGDSLDSDQLGLAMDWLCLHLTDSELKAGFRTKPTTSKSKTVSLLSSNRLILVGSGRTRPIPHPSISLAKPLSSDQEWRDTLRRQTRKLGFLRLGFHHLEAEKACDATMDVSEKVSAEEDEKSLRIMLSLLEKETLGGSFTIQDLKNQADLDFAASERKHELDALEAIYDDQLQAQSSRTNEQSRYSLLVSPIEDLKPPARSEDSKLHVFLRPGYPIVAPPLLLFTNPTLPPTLLRRVNAEMIRQACHSVGEPIVFAIMEFLRNNVHTMQIEFIKEQRTKEMEAEQLRLRKEAGHDVDSVTEAQYEDDGPLGRRQRAKLRAAEKSFDCDSKLQHVDEERRRRGVERLQRIKEQDKSIRFTLAEKEVETRRRKGVEEEAEREGRMAMTASFNRGESIDQARAAARRARNDILRHHGETVSSSSDDEGGGTKDYHQSTRNAIQTESQVTETNVKRIEKDATVPITVGPTEKESSDEKKQKTTPMTMAFMERLRKHYNDAAQEKARHNEVGNESNLPSVGRQKSAGTAKESSEQYHFSYSKEKGDTQLFDQGTRSATLSHIPSPVPIPTGDLVTVMRDVINLQDEQPWLVSPEARVTIVTAEPPTLSSEQLDQRNLISKKLQDELARKYKGTTSVGAPKNGNTKHGSKAHQFQTMLSQRQRLPAFAMRTEILHTIATNQITVVSGDTGCGKTTQVPQLILDDMILNGRGAEANMIVTQPRRISAIGVSERIAAERCENVGETAGYSIRLETKRSSRTRLLLCTTGILLRRLQCDPDLASVSHVFVDEVHERDLNTDFLLIILKELLARRPSLKLVLMSATLNAEAFSSFFGDCPVVSIPGRAHPVQEYRLEDILQLTAYEVKEGSDYAIKSRDSRPSRLSKSVLRSMYYPKYKSSVISSLAIVDESVINYELLAELLSCIALKNEEGAILVFLPGMMEITKAMDELYKKEFFQSSSVIVYPLHSSLSTAEQSSVFRVPPEGVRKIVLATNIAETSITIEDVVFVVDTGRVKENQKDEVNEMPTLVETWVSRASAKQRRGRAGRVRPGFAYHMYSSHTYDRDMQDYQLPEMLRVGLEDLVLQILILDLGEPSVFLAKAINPPSALAMRNSLKLLEGLGAIEVEWRGEALEGNGSSVAKVEATVASCETVVAESGLTALGFHLATLPVDPRVGKMMIYGALFQCIDPALTIAASMTARNPFVSPFDKRDAADEARKQFATDGSDHLTTLAAFNKWNSVRRTKGERDTQSFLKENFLSRLTLFQMEDLRKQFANLLVDIGFLPKKSRINGNRGRQSATKLDASDDQSNLADSNSSNVALVKAVLCAGLYPNIIVAPRSLVKCNGGLSDKQVGECAFQSLKGEVYLHPSTISFSEKRLDSRYCCYREIVKTSKTYVRDCTTVSEFALLLFGGSLKVYHTHGVVTVDDWLKFRIGAKPATLVKHLRAQMETMLLKKIISPEEDITGTEEGKALIQAVSALLAREVNSIGAQTGADIVRPWTGTANEDERNRRNRSGGRGSSTSRGGGRQGDRGSNGRGGRGRGRRA